jgi:hypothetical protein
MSLTVKQRPGRWLFARWPITRVPFDQHQPYSRDVEAIT